MTNRLLGYFRIQFRNICLHTWSSLIGAKISWQNNCITSNGPQTHQKDLCRLTRSRNLMTPQMLRQEQVPGLVVDSGARIARWSHQIVQRRPVHRAPRNSTKMQRSGNICVSEVACEKMWKNWICTLHHVWQKLLHLPPCPLPEHSWTLKPMEASATVLGTVTNMSSPPLKLSCNRRVAVRNLGCGHVVRMLKWSTLGEQKLFPQGQGRGEAGEHESREELIMSTFQSSSAFEFKNISDQ